MQINKRIIEPAASRAREVAGFRCKHNGKDITEDFLRAHIFDIHQQIYLCGPDPMMTAIEGLLASLNIDKSNIIKEAVPLEEARILWQR